MRTDRSETGGLFVGRRPGTAPIRFRALPQRAGELRQRVDGSFAGLMLTGMTILSLLCWGPIPSPASGWARARTTSREA